MEGLVLGGALVGAYIFKEIGRGIEKRLQGPPPPPVVFLHTLPSILQQRYLYSKEEAEAITRSLVAKYGHVSPLKLFKADPSKITGEQQALLSDVVAHHTVE